MTSVAAHPSVDGLPPTPSHSAAVLAASATTGVHLHSQGGSLRPSRSYQYDLNQPQAHRQYYQNSGSQLGVPSDSHVSGDHKVSSLRPSSSNPSLKGMLSGQYYPSAAPITEGKETAPAGSHIPHVHHAHHHHQDSSISVTSTPSYLPLISKPSIVEYKHYRFIIHDAPLDSNLVSYLDFLLKKHTVALVRACEPTYNPTPLIENGIRVIEMPFKDGSPPPEHVLQLWLDTVEEVFGTDASQSGKESKSKDSEKESKVKEPPTPEARRSIACHCVAGLGRAPVLVCIALIESGLHWQDAVDVVRKKRRGALNITQLQYLESYKPRQKGKDKCVIQ